jgi:hypothetical protein
MKKQNRKLNKHKVQELAEQFQEELNRKLPVTVLPDGGIVYKDYLVKQTKDGNWALYNYKQTALIDQFFLKTCALMAAKSHSLTKIEQYFEVKRLDTQYWANHSDTRIFKNNIKLAKEFERYLILLNRLEESTIKERFYKEEISKMFKWTFV